MTISSRGSPTRSSAVRSIPPSSRPCCAPATGRVRPPRHLVAAAGGRRPRLPRRRRAPLRDRLLVLSGLGTGRHAVPVPGGGTRRGDRPASGRPPGLGGRAGRHRRLCRLRPRLRHLGVRHGGRPGFGIAASLAATAIVLGLHAALRIVRLTGWGLSASLVAFTGFCTDAGGLAERLHGSLVAGAAGGRRGAHRRAAPAAVARRFRGGLAVGGSPGDGRRRGRDGRHELRRSGPWHALLTLVVGASLMAAARCDMPSLMWMGALGSLVWLATLAVVVGSSAGWARRRDRLRSRAGCARGARRPPARAGAGHAGVIVPAPVIAPPRSSALDPHRIARFEDDAVVLLDQTRLPGEAVEMRLQTWQEVAAAIRGMVVRGAPAIGIAAAYGVALAAARSGAESVDGAARGRRPCVLGPRRDPADGRQPALGDGAHARVRAGALPRRRTRCGPRCAPRPSRCTPTRSSAAAASAATGRSSCAPAPRC